MMFCPWYTFGNERERSKGDGVLRTQDTHGLISLSSTRFHQRSWARRSPFSVSRAFPSDRACSSVCFSDFKQGRDAVHAVEGHHWLSEQMLTATRVTLTGEPELWSRMLSCGRGSRQEEREKLHFKSSLCLLVSQRKKEIDKTHGNFLTSVSTKFLQTLLHKGFQNNPDWSCNIGDCFVYTFWRRGFFLFFFLSQQLLRFNPVFVTEKTERLFRETAYHWNKTKMWPRLFRVLCVCSVPKCLSRNA